MDQKPQQSSDTPNQTPPAAPSTPPAEPSSPPPAPSTDEHTPTPAPASTPEHSSENTPPASTPTAPSSADASHGSAPGSTPPPPPTPEHPHDVHPGKSKTMLYAIVTLAVVVIGALLVTFMSSTSKEPEATQPVTTEQTQQVPPTEAPSVTPAPSVGTPEEEVEAVNTTVDDSDLQQVDKDLQSL